MKHEVAALANEKEMMAKVPAVDGDIIYLNVGGTAFTTRRSTLTQVTFLCMLHNERSAYLTHMANDQCMWVRVNRCTPVTLAA